MGTEQETSAFGRFMAEMKRRHVVRFAFAYAAAAFVVLQLAEIVFPAFGIGEGGLRVLVVLTGLGFLPALVLAWIYDVTSEGIRRTDGTGDGPSRTAVVALVLTTVVVTGGLGLYLVDQGVLTATPPSESAEGPVRMAEYDPAEPIRSVAVLPLDDFSPSADQAYFTSGIHEELIAKLSMAEDIRVVSRTTVMRYAADRPASPQIGTELNVDALVEGSVTRSGDSFRVTLQIIHAASDSHIETLQWQRDGVEDFLAFQTEIADDVVAVLHGSHGHGETEPLRVASVDPQAQDAYLRGRHEYDRGTEDGYRMALQYFQEALDEDPGFAAAMAGAAGARFLMGLEDPTSMGESVTLAHEEALSALEMDSTSIEAREVLAFIERGMPASAGAITVAAVPPPPELHVLTFPGRDDSIVVNASGFDTAWATAVTSLGERIEQRLIRSGVVAIEAAPGQMQTLEARRLMRSGDYVAASRLLEGVVERDPDVAPAWDMLARALAETGRADEATAVMRAWSESGAPGSPDPDAVRALETSVDAAGLTGYWRWTAERLHEAERAGRPVPRTELAAAHARVGEVDQAFSYLFEAFEQGESGVLSLRSDPVWDPLRPDPRFRELARAARTMRFGSTWREAPGGPPTGR